MSFWDKISCPVCNEEGSVVVWRQQLGGENKIHYYFKCNKCKREWH